MEQRLRGEAARNSGTGVGAMLQVLRRVAIDALGCKRIAQHDRLRETLVAQATCRRHDPVVGALGKNRFEPAPTNARAGFCQNVHDLASFALRVPASLRGH